MQVAGPVFPKRTKTCYNYMCYGFEELLPKHCALDFNIETCPRLNDNMIKNQLIVNSITIKKLTARIKILEDKEKEMQNKIKTNSGDLSMYGFACGYIEREQIEDIVITLECEEGIFHIKVSDTKKTGLISWNNFEKLTEARQFYKKKIKKYKKRSLK